MALFERAPAPAPKPALAGALPNDVFGVGSDLGAPWSSWIRAHGSILDEEEPGNRGSGWLRAAPPHPVPALPLGGGVRLRGGNG